METFDSVKETLWWEQRRQRQTRRRSRAPGDPELSPCGALLPTADGCGRAHAQAHADDTSTPKHNAAAEDFGELHSDTDSDGLRDMETLQSQLEQRVAAVADEAWALQRRLPSPFSAVRDRASSLGRDGELSYSVAAALTSAQAALAAAPAPVARRPALACDGHSTVALDVRNYGVALGAEARSCGAPASQAHPLRRFQAVAVRDGDEAAASDARCNAAALAVAAPPLAEPVAAPAAEMASSPKTEPTAARSSDLSASWGSGAWPPGLALTSTAFHYRSTD